MKTKFYTLTLALLIGGLTFAATTASAGMGGRCEQTCQNPTGGHPHCGAPGTECDTWEFFGEGVGPGLVCPEGYFVYIDAYGEGNEIIEFTCKEMPCSAAPGVPWGMCHERCQNPGEYANCGGPGTGCDSTWVFCEGASFDGEPICPDGTTIGYEQRNPISDNLTAFRCDPIPIFTCKGNPHNSWAICDGDLDGLVQETDYTFIGEGSQRCNPDIKCQAYCPDGSYENDGHCHENQCVREPAHSRFCDGAEGGLIPGHGDKEPVVVEICTGQEKCEVYCKENHHKVGNECINDNNADPEIKNTCPPDGCHGNETHNGFRLEPGQGYSKNIMFLEFRLNGTDYCDLFTNNSGFEFFVPTKKRDEYESFREAVINGNLGPDVAWGNCLTCGNGDIDDGELCDGENLNEQDCTTIPGGFAGGELQCNGICNGWNIDNCGAGPPPICNNNTLCDLGETCANCPGDCGACAPYCGDGACNGGETCATCVPDCGACAPYCGDGACNGGETCATCVPDCGACAPYCGDGICNGVETCATCVSDCGACEPYCGDGICNGAETCANCQDCHLPEETMSKCFAGDRYWYDACNERGNIRQDCQDLGCAADTCLSPPECNNNQSCEAGETCANCQDCHLPEEGKSWCWGGDRYWFDACNERGEMRQECDDDNPCTTDGCAADTCSYINQPVNGGWNNPGWSACSETCGGGTQTRTKTCNSPTPSCGGDTCPGAAFESRACNEQDCGCVPDCGNPATHACGSTYSNGCPGGATGCTGTKPVNGGWNNPGWSACSETCGGGTQTRTKTCNSPAPSCGGDACPGAAAESRACNEQCCPVNGRWGDWIPWDGCTESCGGGVQWYGRICDNPPPSCGGAGCAGEATKTEDCNTQACITYSCVKDLSSWSCSLASCGTKVYNGKCQGSDGNPAPLGLCGGSCGPYTSHSACNVPHCHKFCEEGHCVNRGGACGIVGQCH